MSSSDIKAISIDDLLDGLQGRDPKAPDPVDLWVKARGYYPGSTREGSSKLYSDFKEWLVQESGLANTRPPHIRTWGKKMGDRFRRGHTQKGEVYYISRQAIPSIDL